MVANGRFAALHWRDASTERAPMKRSPFVMAAAIGAALAIPALASAQAGTCNNPANLPTSGVTSDGSLNWLAISATNGSTTPTPSGAQPSGDYCGVATSGLGTGFGYVWAMSGNGLVRIDPNTNETVGYTATVNNAQWAAQAGNYLWVSTPDRATGFTSTGVSKIKVAAPTSKKYASGTSSVVKVSGSTVWVGNADYRVVQKVSSSNGKVSLSFPVSNTPRNLALSGSAIWVLSSSPNSAVRAYNTSSGKALSASTALSGAPFGLVATGGAMWIFTQKYIYKFSTSSYKQLARYAQSLPPGSTIFNGRAVVSGLGGVWMLSQQCQLYRFDTASHSVNLKTSTGAACGNGSSEMVLASGSLWTNLLGGSAFPAGHTVVRSTPVS